MLSNFKKKNPLGILLKIVELAVNCEKIDILLF